MMSNLLQEETVSKIASFDGIDIYSIKTDKFKTSSVSIFFHTNLDRERATKNAMIPAVLRRGCRRFPTFQEIALHLEELYGATFDCGVTKMGERHIIQFYIEFVSEMFTEEGSNQFDKAFDLLYEIITQPVLENEVFKDEYVKQEKDNLKRLIESRVNDKMLYAVEKCLEEVCKDEPYGIYDYGFVSDLKDINAKNLYEQYIAMLETYPVQVYIAGSASDKSVERAIEKLKKLRPKTDGTFGDLADKKLFGPSPESFNKSVNKVRNVVERFSVNQGKLSLGFRTNIRPDSKEYYALLVYNGILGGGVHSKLFQNVREKASLAYYAFSRLEKFKGLMVVSSGIEIANKDKALEIILQQIDEIKAGNITDYEFESTIKTIETSVKSLKDNQLQIVTHYLGQAIANTSDTFDDLISKTSRVTKQEVIDVAKKIQLDTIYFLTSKEQA